MNTQVSLLSRLNETLQMELCYFLDDTSLHNIKPFFHTTTLELLSVNAKFAFWLLTLYFQQDQLWTAKAFRHICNNCGETGIANILKRIFPYKESWLYETWHPYNLPLINLNTSVYTKRVLNKYEKILFRTSNDGVLGISNEQSTGIFNTFPQFLALMDNWFSYYLWKDILVPGHVVVAGGSVVQCLKAKQPLGGVQDIDIFILKAREKENPRLPLAINTELKLEELLSAKHIPWIRRNDTCATYKIHRVSTYIIYLPDQIIKMQLIHPICDQRLWQLLYGFDIDACQVGFDGHEISATSAFVESFRTMTTISYKINDIGLPFYKRFEKYATRFGLLKLIPNNARYKTPIEYEQDELKYEAIKSWGNIPYPLNINYGTPNENNLAILNNINNKIKFDILRNISEEHAIHEYAMVNSKFLLQFFNLDYYDIKQNLVVIIINRH